MPNRAYFVLWVACDGHGSGQRLLRNGVVTRPEPLRSNAALAELERELEALDERRWPCTVLGLVPLDGPALGQSVPLLPQGVPQQPGLPDAFLQARELLSQELASLMRGLLLEPSRRANAATLRTLLRSNSRRALEALEQGDLEAAVQPLARLAASALLAVAALRLDVPGDRGQREGTGSPDRRQCGDREEG
jgi:hypothetical protein